MVLRVLVSGVLLGVVFGLGRPAAGMTQEPQNFLSVGEVAPDIQLAGATRYGTVVEPVKLSDFKGETVVLAFFFKVRTGG